MHLKICAVFLLIFCYCGANADIFPKGEGTSIVLGVLTCPFRNEPYACLRSQVGRALDVGDRALEIQTEQLKVDADNELEKRIQSRAISSQEIPKQKPSAIMDSYQSVISTLGDYIAEEVDDYLTDKPKSKKKLIKNKSDGEEPTDYSVDVEGHDIVDISGDEDKDNKHGVNLNHVTHGEIINKNINNKNDEFLNDNNDDENENETDEHVNGRSNGELRGKKKKKKKALMKLLVLGAVIKGKIELLLKLLSAHLQIKFFGIALIGLLLNIVRFWIDLKKAPPKVIYYEHAQHQHHYEDHGEEGWGGSGSSGGYWKRSIDEPQQENTSQYGQWQQPQQQQQQQQQQPQQVYQSSNQWKRSFNSGSYFGIPIPLSNDAQHLAYSQQMPVNA